ncbi:MAG: universal stress protein [Bdellovibrionales bacterium]|nr:universal stress protein [Bdellovibrionales bacterium]
MSHFQSKKVVWGVDPFEESGRTISAAKRAIQYLLQGAEVYPVFAPGSAIPEVSISVEQAQVRGLKEFWKKRLADTPGKPLAHVAGLSVLGKPSNGVREAAKRLVKFSQSIDAELILVATHSRKGLSRLLLGSFTETLVTLSPIPVLTVHPGWQPSAGSHTVFFATDFSEASEKAFEKVLQFCAETQRKLVIFNKVIFNDYPMGVLAPAVYVAYEEAFDAQVLESKKKANQWVKKAKSMKLSASAVVDSERGTAVTDSILKRVNGKAYMVALASQSGPFLSVLGSTTRQVIRGSHQPVWVIHPKAKTLKQKKPTPRSAPRS